MSNTLSTASKQQLQHHLTKARDLVLEGLIAGKYVSVNAQTEPHYAGEAISFVDRTVGDPRTGQLVIVDELTSDILENSVQSELRSYVIMCGWIGEGVDLGKARADRIANTETDHYWATYVLNEAVLVSIGAPPSSCRLTGEILNLQIPEPFVQWRVCAVCHTLNDYYSLQCKECGKPLSATGRLE